jgi:hypothetical protein
LSSIRAEPGALELGSHRAPGDRIVTPVWRQSAVMGQYAGTSDFSGAYPLTCHGIQINGLRCDGLEEFLGNTAVDDP